MSECCLLPYGIVHIKNFHPSLLEEAAMHLHLTNYGLAKKSEVSRKKHNYGCYIYLYGDLDEITSAKYSEKYDECFLPFRRDLIECFDTSFGMRLSLEFMKVDTSAWFFGT